jgi:pseudouridine-5'-phosphate glycosidase
LNNPSIHSQYFQLSPEITQARRLNLPIVALESAVITHGLPRPENYQLACGVETEIRAHQAIPATIALLDGKIRVGLDQASIERLSNILDAHKVSRRDFAPVLAARASGGTTVAGTLLVAHKIGIKVFSTGGIGGVHRQTSYDISADLQELSHSPLVVVCAGAKAILDLPATLEYLETMAIPVIGYQTDEFPAFYSTSSGLKLNASAASPAEIAQIANVHWELGLESAILVVVPPPPEIALPRQEVEKVIAQTLREAQAQAITGPAVTPFLLNRVSELTGGASLRANLELLRNNARLAAQIANQLPALKKRYAEI